MADKLSSDLASLRINRDEAPRRSLSALITLAVLVTLCLLAYFVGYPYVEASLFRSEVQATEIALISPAQAAIELTSTGYVIAESSSKVGAKVAGRIARVLVKEGDTVSAGQVLAVLEDADQRSVAASARARAQAARARAQTARANLAEAELKLARDKALLARGAVAQAVVQDEEARIAALREQVRSADADVQAAEAEAGTAGLNLQHMTITAPIAGTVVRRPLRPGEMVGPTAEPILELQDLTSLIVETDVPEARLSRVRKGGPCEIILDAYPQKRFRGMTREIIPRVNRAKATVAVKVGFVDPPEGVLPDMAARVSFLTSALDEKSVKEPPRLVVPKAAVADREGARVVFTIDGDRVRMTPVSLGAEMAGGFELKQGPPAGTRVVKNPPPRLMDGQKIKEKND